MLVTKRVVRLLHPSEEGQWIDVRLPLSAGDIELMREGGTGGMVTNDLLAAVITGWSAPDPVSLENIQRLDLDTFTWLAKELTQRSGIRDEAEKKDSNSSSPPTSAPGEGDSPTSSAT